MARGRELPRAARFATALLLLLTTAILSACGEGNSTSKQGTIAFSTVGRAHFGFDLFGVQLPEFLLQRNSSDVLELEDVDKIRLTDGVSINYNGQLVEGEGRLAALDYFRYRGVNGKIVVQRSEGCLLLSCCDTILW